MTLSKWERVQGEREKTSILKQRSGERALKETEQEMKGIQVAVCICTFREQVDCSACRRVRFLGGCQDDWAR